jgi:LacI family transcriptional regulator
MKGRRKITMADVGRAAGGYHPSTVSLALRNDPEISLRVRTLLQKTAKKLGYRRDPFLDAFNRHRTQGLVRRTKQVIAFVADFASKNDMEASNAHWAMWKSGHAAARKLQHQLEFFSLRGESMTTKRLDAVLHARGVEGVVIAALRNVAAPQDFAWERYSAVLIDTDWPGSLGCSVEPAFLEGSRMAFERLRRRGCQRIGLVTLDRADLKHNAFVRAGVLCEQQKQPSDQRVPELVMGDGVSAAEAKAWLCRYRVDSVMASQAVYRRLAALAGRSFLRNIVWACADTVDAPLDTAGVEVNYAALGTVAVEQVVGLMRSHERGAAGKASTTFVPVSWREGDGS